MNYIPNTPEGTRDRLFGECMERRSVQSDPDPVCSAGGDIRKL